MDNVYKNIEIARRLIDSNQSFEDKESLLNKLVKIKREINDDSKLSFALELSSYYGAYSVNKLQEFFSGFSVHDIVSDVAKAPQPMQVGAMIFVTLFGLACILTPANFVLSGQPLARKPAGYVEKKLYTHNLTSILQKNYPTQANYQIGVSRTI